MGEKASLHLIIAAFDGQTRAGEALVQLKESRDKELVGIQAAVALHKDEAGEIHAQDVGLTPAKGAAGGVLLGAVVGILTGGAGLALGALGGLVGGLVGRKARDSSRLPDRIHQMAGALRPGTSAILLVMETGWIQVVEEQLTLLGGDVVRADIPPGWDQELDAEQEAAYVALLSQLQSPE
ncbi:MAG: DUF1269 domain-containing protein [Anaerolineae bacterium]|jgi:uncharacterized membrane protein